MKHTSSTSRQNAKTLQDSFNTVIEKEKSNRKAFQKASMIRLEYVISFADRISKEQHSSFREEIQKFLNEKGIKTGFSENMEDNFPYYMELVFFYVMIKAGYKIDKDFASEKSKVLRACRQLLEMGLTKKTRKGIRLFCEKNHITSVRKLADQYSQEHPSKQKNDGHAHQDDADMKDGSVSQSKLSSTNEVEALKAMLSDEFWQRKCPPIYFHKGGTLCIWKNTFNNAREQIQHVDLNDGSVFVFAVIKGEHNDQNEKLRT